MAHPLGEFEKIAKGVVERHLGQALWAEYVVARERVFTQLAVMPHTFTEPNRICQITVQSISWTSCTGH